MNKRKDETSYKQTAFGIIPRSKLILLEIEGIKRAWDFILKKRWLIIGIITFTLVVLGVVVIFAGQKYSLKKKAETPTQEVSPIATIQISSPAPSADPLNNWIVYKSIEFGFEFKYPPNYQIIKSESDYISVGTIEKREYPPGESFVKELFIITSKNLTDYNSIKRCEVGKDWQQPLPCLWTGITKKNLSGNEKEINDIKIDQMDAKSFYVQEGITTNYHIIQTIEEPLLEIKIDTNDKKASQILSSFKFFDQSSIIDTSSWEEYYDDGLNFSVKLPKYYEVSTGHTGFLGFSNKNNNKLDIHFQVAYGGMPFKNLEVGESSGDYKRMRDIKLSNTKAVVIKNTSENTWHIFVTGHPDFSNSDKTPDLRDQEYRFIVADTGKKEDNNLIFAILETLEIKPRDHLDFE